MRRHSRSFPRFPPLRRHYLSGTDLADLAAAYAFGLVTSHPYRDGNKRVGFLAAVVFLGINGADFDAPEADIVTCVMTLAAGRLPEPKLADWIRRHTKKPRG